jgi:hypothetical protein
MKKLFSPSDLLLVFVGFGIAFLLFSCSKPADEMARPASDNESKIEFSLDGSQKTYIDVNAGVTRVTGVNVYSFVGTKVPTNENIFTISFPAVSLNAGTYNVKTGVVSFREGGVVATNVSSVDFVVTITSNVNGLVNGSFSGTLYNHSTQKNSTCVQGLIQNIQLSN